MRYAFLTTIAGAYLALGLPDAHARLTSFDAELRVEIIRTVHKPTGCKAKVELHDGAFAGGYIIDPSCLPNGVTERPIPARSYDFSIPRIK